MTMDSEPLHITVGVLALQGTFSEHLQLLRKAITTPPVPFPQNTTFNFIAVRTPEQLASCDALILPGGESTTISLIAERSNLLEPLRQFVKLNAKPVWGTCAGMILLSERANRTKRDGQQLIGGLDVVINRNYFGRQVESFEYALDMPAPVIENLLDAAEAASARSLDPGEEDTEVRTPVVEGWKRGKNEKVEILEMTGDSHRTGEAIVDQGHTVLGKKGVKEAKQLVPRGNIVVVRQGNVVGTSFHPELTGNVRMYRW
ncbi:pyridoxine synthesis protein PDX2 [Tirmania nivea]|nr:pyridoxine synthesis protein PDX2 [Tirmania nivea]